jgi:hypothetical protein
MNNSPFTQTAVRVLGLVALMAVVLIPLLFLDFPENTRFWQSLFNAGHAPVFGVLSLLFLGLSLVTFGDNFKRQLTHYLVALIASIVMAFGTEIAQIFTGRDAEMGDVLRDIIGAVAILGLTMTVDRKLYKSLQLPTGWRVVLARVVCVLLLISPLVSVTIWSLAYRDRDRMVPYLYRFDSCLGHEFMRAEAADLEIVAPPAGWPEPGTTAVGRLTFHRTLYPQMYIDELYPDWRGYDTLRFDLYLPRPDSCRLTLRINDWLHNQEFNDRYNHTFWIQPGVTRMAIPLADIAAAPAGRPMQMDRIKTLILFSPQPSDTFSIYLGPMFLSR